jgi:hypothetical protein
MVDEVADTKVNIRYVFVFNIHSNTISFLIVKE